MGKGSQSDMPLTYHTLWKDTSEQPHDTGVEREDSNRHNHTQLVKAVLWPKVQKGGKTKLGADELEPRRRRRRGRRGQPNYLADTGN